MHQKTVPRRRGDGSLPLLSKSTAPWHSHHLELPSPIPIIITRIPRREWESGNGSVIDFVFFILARSWKGIITVDSFASRRSNRASYGSLSDLENPTSGQRTREAYMHLLCLMQGLHGVEFDAIDRYDIRHFLHLGEGFSHAIVSMLICCRCRLINLQFDCRASFFISSRNAPSADWRASADGAQLSAHRPG